MSSVKFLTLFAVLCACSGLGHGDWVTTQKPVTITLPKAAPVLPLNAEVPKQVAAESEGPATEGTISHPHTTTSTTTTTTSTTTTTTTTTTSTTPAPSPTPPTPKPAPDQGMWWYTDKDNITCVIVQFAAQLNITYFPGNNTKDSQTTILNFPKNATVTNGNCNGTEQWIELSWPAVNDSASNTLTLVFQSNATTGNYQMKSVNITLNPDMLVNASTTEIDLYHGQGWQTPLQTSYRCNTPMALKLTSNTNIAGIVTVSRVQEEAFRKTSAKGFSAARECGGGDVPDAVPIAVGCALGGLVVVVLVAYLVARRRSAARGYLSM